MLDPVSLRVAFGMVSACVLAVSYFVTYRGTRSAYSGWWCLALVAFVLGSLLYLFNGTSWQAVANPLGNAITVLGVALVFAACRALAKRPIPYAALVGAPVFAWLFAVVDNPGEDVWPGGTVFLTVMTVLFGVTCGELLHLLRTIRLSETHRMEFRASLATMSLLCGFLAVFYAGRAVTFAAVGPDHPFFATFFGTSAVCLVQMVMLVIASSSLTTLSYRDETMALRERAARDPLTGVLNRDGLAIVLDDRSKRQPSGLAESVIMADLDEFKGVNDLHGHDAGDEALVAFARAARETVGKDGVVARLGGDEFLIAVRGVDPEEIIAAIDRLYPAPQYAGRMPTISYGIADVLPGEEIMAAATRADRALYRAKAGGRGRAVRHRG